MNQKSLEKKKNMS